MSVPSLNSYQPGIGVFTADWANGLTQSGALISDLRAFSGYQNMTVFTIGAVSAGDGGGQLYYWNSTATGPDNNSTIIVPNGTTQGAWVSVGSLLGSAASTALVVGCTAAGNNAIVLTPTAASVSVSAYANYAMFSFVAPATSSGAVTLSVSGLPALPLYTASGRTQAGTNADAPQDIIAGTLYQVCYNSVLNSNGGGFQIVGGGGQQINDTPFQTITPVNNPLTTLSSFAVTATTAGVATRQFLASFGLISNSGAGTAGADRVAVYAATEGTAGSSDIWSINSLTQMDASFPVASNAVGYELDYNNNCQNRGATDGIGGFAAPTYKGFLVTGSSTFSSTCAIAIEGDTNTQWYRGVSVNEAVSIAAYCDYTNATTGIEMQAAHAGWGIDMNGSALTGALRIPNGSVIVGRNQAGTADVTIADVTSGNNLVIGSNNANTAAAAGIVFGVGAYPFVNNAYQFGTSANLWSSIWASNGTIQTSDPALKADITPLPSVMGLIDKISPITFRWKFGGYDVVETTEEREVHDTETVEFDHHDIVVENGAAKRVPVRKTITREAYDTVPLLDEHGDQIITVIKARPATYDSQGRLIRPATPEARVPEVHRVPRMVRKTVTVQTRQPREGRRTHWGFDAAQVKAAFDETGMDFGGYVRSEDGTHHLRPDQLISVLWQAVKELKAEVETLKGRFGVPA